MNEDIRYGRIVEWRKPRKGMDKEGKEVTANVTLRATPEDCINIQRERVRVLWGQTNPSDEVLLEDFFTTHWAFFATDCRKE